MNNFNRKKMLATALIAISGIFVFLISSWNARQAEILLNWAAEREGKNVFTRLVHENGMSPGILFRSPELLAQQIASDVSIIAAGLMLGDEIIASHSIKTVEYDEKILQNPPMGTTILNSELTLYRKASGPGSGHGGRWQGSGNGPPWMRNSSITEDGNTENRISFYVVFAGPDRAIIAPLIYQKYLWPVVWLLLSLLWGIILLNQSKLAELQQQLQKESHLTAIGKMSARLAHEIKNPLGAIRGMAQLLEKRLADQTPLQTMTQTIEKETFRLEELTRSILDFAKPAELKPIEMNFNTAVSDTVSLFALQNAAAKIDTKLPEQPIIAHGDENAIRQILLNLLKNAIDASSEEVPVIIDLSKKNNGVLIRIINAGQLNDEVKEHLFEPFFSTKIRGYGLGLPICLKLARQLNGTLMLKNLDCKQVVAELYLPGSEQHEQDQESYNTSR